MKKLTCTVLCLLLSNYSYSMSKPIDIPNNTNNSSLQSSITDSEEYFADGESLASSFSLNNSKGLAFSAEHIVAPSNTPAIYASSEVSEQLANSGNDSDWYLYGDLSSSSSDDDIDIFGYLSSSSEIF